MYFLSPQKTRYRFPALRWHTEANCWVIQPQNIVTQREIIEDQPIDPSAIPQPICCPGQRVQFLDTYGRRHRGTIEAINIYGCTYQDSQERDYWFAWAYLSKDAITYWTRCQDGRLYQLFATAITHVG